MLKIKRATAFVQKAKTVDENLNMGCVIILFCG
jgi:hypothetical protein